MAYHAALGNEVLVPQMRLNQVKGNLVLSRRWYLTEHLDGKGINRVLAALKPSARSLLERQVMPFSWQDFGLLMEVDLAIISEIMDGRVDKMRDKSRRWAFAPSARVVAPPSSLVDRCPGTCVSTASPVGLRPCSRLPAPAIFR
jgi:hypothetical protein